MSEELTNMDVWQNKVHQDIAELRQRQLDNESKLGLMEKDIHKLQISDQLQDKEISSLKETLSEIKEDTNWIRRKITGAIITAVITAIVGGILAYGITQIWG